MNDTAEELHAKLYPEAAAKPEYILCAAVHLDNGTKYQHQPINIESGIVITGRRHHNAIYLETLLGWCQYGKIHDGFLTSKDRFVDRKEGANIAFAVGQITRDSECLVSEDLY